ncbi:MAG TPA: hypothetical protein VNT50_08335 [Microbacterium sp.]|uniref:hypothetical protein n=1 Tax=Microbacterium sp. TaxID=51671 RepID=UPI002C851EFE|nr:hypothetical protein [Microbacterium sp.]HWI31487.1 hypothetical protein [Microbacterium sp.]
MSEALDALLPAAVVFGLAALAVVVAVWTVHRARRSPRARAAAEAQRAQAGSVLIALDDAVGDLDIEVGLSGALYGGDSAAMLRRARMSAQHARDQAFREYRDISGSDIAPPAIARTAERIRTRCEKALAAVAAARATHAEWMSAHVSVPDQVEAASRRLAEVRAMIGDPAALVHELSTRFDESEWRSAADAARAALAAVDTARDLLAAAAAKAADPSLSALPEVAAAERALRTARAEANALEEAHRLITQAAAAVPDELEAARAAVRQAIALRDTLPPTEADRLGTAIRQADAAIAEIETDAARRPTATVDALARRRTALDLALGDARTAQQRLRGARTALPGTLAAARGAIAQAESALAHAPTNADARVRLASAQDELAAARQSGDPVAALDGARRAMRDAEDAKALADYARMGPR